MSQDDPNVDQVMEEVKLEVETTKAPLPKPNRKQRRQRASIRRRNIVRDIKLLQNALKSMGRGAKARKAAKG